MALCIDHRCDNFLLFECVCVRAGYKVQDIIKVERSASPLEGSAEAERRRGVFIIQLIC